MPNVTGHHIIFDVFAQSYFLITNMRVATEEFLPRDASAERGDATVSRLSVCNVQVPYSNRLEFFENNFTAE